MERITASEAIFGFASWLTCLAQAVTLGSGHDAAPAAELVSQYLDANDLPHVRDGIYPNNLTPPPNG